MPPRKDDMRQTGQTGASGAHPKLRVALASSAQDVLNAQHLRYQVFGQEMGAQLNTGNALVDVDRFDPHCDHLLVRDEATGEVVGTYRILAPAKAKAIGGYYAESEFDLTRLAALRDGLVEVGRSCVHPRYRNGAVIALLWSGLVDYMIQGGYAFLMGCAIMPMTDGGHAAVATFDYLKAQHMGPDEWRVVPHTRVPLESIAAAPTVQVPPLLRSYLRAGACICGEPAWDASFNTADLLLLLPMSRIEARYRRHFVKRPA